MKPTEKNHIRRESQSLNMNTVFSTPSHVHQKNPFKQPAPVNNATNREKRRSHAGNSRKSVPYHEIGDEIKPRRATTSQKDAPIRLKAQTWPPGVYSSRLRRNRREVAARRTKKAGTDGKDQFPRVPDPTSVTGSHPQR